MKKIFLFTLVSINILMLSCSDDLLDKTLNGVTTSNNFYRNEDEIKLALTGCYAELKGESYNNIPRLLSIIGDVSTDDAYKGGSSESDNTDDQQIQNFTVTTFNGDVSDLWSNLYAVINRCNIVLEKVPGASGSEILLSRYVNEAKFLRAFSYYLLTVNFGGVPLVLKPLETGEALIPRSSQEDVFVQIYSDLQDATNLPLKSGYSSADIGRASSGAAWALMGKAYLFEGNVVKAEESLKNVVESGEYQLSKEFQWNFLNEYKNGIESIFEIQYQAISGVWGSGQTILIYFSSRTNEGGWGFHCPTQDLWDQFDQGDPRLIYTFILTGDRFVGDNYDQNNSVSPSGYHDRKIFVSKQERGPDFGNVSKNWVLLRYADVLLMYAEVLNENGKPNEALTYLNAVRTRARNSNPVDVKREKQFYTPVVNISTLPDITTLDPNELRTMIWKERRCELALEGQRRYDLIRQEQYGAVMKSFATKYNSVKGHNFNDSRDDFLPIPGDQVLLSQGTLEQNPGY